MSKGIAHKRRAATQVYLGIAALVVVAIVVSASVYWIATRPKPPNPVTLCPPDGPSGHIVLMVDKTDPLNFTQKTAFLEFLSEFGKGGVREGELFSVFALGEDYKDSPAPLFEMCNPGQGNDKNIWTSNPEKIRRQYDEKFTSPMNRLVDQLTSVKSAKFSPILEMLQMVAINGFRKNAVKGPKKLIIVSDMLQNTPDYTHYGGEASFAELKKTGYFQKIRTDFSGIEVELVYLMHTPSLQTRRNVKFWEDYFHEMNASLIAVKTLEG